MPSKKLRRKKAKNNTAGGDTNETNNGSTNNTASSTTGGDNIESEEVIDSGNSTNNRLASVFSRGNNATSSNHGGDRKSGAIRQTSSSSHLVADLRDEYKKYGSGNSGILGRHRKRGSSTGDESNRLSRFGGFTSKLKHNDGDEESEQPDEGVATAAEEREEQQDDQEEEHENSTSADIGSGGGGAIPTIAFEQDNTNEDSVVATTRAVTSPSPEPVEDNEESSGTGGTKLPNVSSSSSLNTSFKAPLARLKKKTVSMLFSGDNSNNVFIDFMAKPASAEQQQGSRPSDSSSSTNNTSSNTPAIESSTFLGTELSRTASTNTRRPALLRSLSSQSGAVRPDIDGEQQPAEKQEQENGKSSKTDDIQNASKDVSSRRRSKTLNSLNESPNTNNNNKSSAFASFFGSSKLKAPEPSPDSNIATSPTSKGSASRRHSPSPRPSQAGNRESSSATATDSEFDTLPEPIEEESEYDYLARLKVLGYGSATAALLSKHGDNGFYRNALQIYIDSFDFKDEPLDMALREFLMFARLPRETQQIDRVLESFAATYHKNNPGVYVDSEAAYIVVFALMILHTDFFNKNNKQKMQKSEFIRNTYAKGVPNDVLECFYDNITYTPFIHTDEDFIAPTRLPWARRSSTFGRNGKDMLDPYSLIIECRLDVIRPSLGAVLNLEDPYGYCTPKTVDEFKQLRQQFIDGPYLQLVSQRSRPEAFMSTDPNSDLEKQHMGDPGVVDIKVVKVGILYRREARRMLYSKSTWKEWGAILTASQLYLFKDVSWIKTSILSQSNNDMSDSSAKSSDISFSSVNKNQNGEGIIRAPIDGFHPSSVLSTFDMTAMSSSRSGETNSSKNFSFLIAGRGGSQDWFAASSQEDMEDWMMKINFAASFNTYHVGIQGVVCEEQSPQFQQQQRMNSSNHPHRMHSLRRPRHTQDGEDEDEEDEENNDDTIEAEISEDPPQHQEQPESTMAPTPPSSSSSTSISLTMANNDSRNREDDLIEESRAYEELHDTRVQLVEQKLHEIEKKCNEKSQQLDEHIRTGHHLKILAPIQQRTRETIIFAAGRLTAKLDWHWLDSKRLFSYRDMFQMELQVEKELCEEARKANPEHFHEFVLTQPSTTDLEETLPQETLPQSNSNIDETTTTTTEARSSSLRTAPSSTGSLYFDPTTTNNNLPFKDNSSIQSENSPQQQLSPNNSHNDRPVPTLRDSEQLSTSSSGSMIKPFQKSLREKSLRIKKRPSKEDTKDEDGNSNNTEQMKRSASLMRKEEDFTLHGKKFSVVEVNPEFAHKRTTQSRVDSSNTASVVTDDDDNAGEITGDEHIGEDEEEIT